MSSRYSDNPNRDDSTSSNNWQSNNDTFQTSRNNSQPTTGSKGNPIGNWIHRRRRRQQPTCDDASRRQRPVGTEALALENISRNALHFHYPPEGFVAPIEHSLLYSMILHPEQYPESAVRKEIEDEEFEVYLYVKDDRGRGDYANNNDNDASKEDDNAGNNATSSTRRHEGRASYAQLSALLALSAEKSPSVAAPDSSSQPPPSEPRNSLTMEASTGIAHRPSDADPSIGQALCRKILKTVTKYSESHNLDRPSEIRELLHPVERRCAIRNERSALKQLLPAYAGYALSVATGNPLPLLIGAAALAREDPMGEENVNVSEMRGMGGRMGDVETAGLLDECDDD